MIDFALMNKALKSIWIKRFHLSENSAWTVIPNEATSHLGGLTFLLTCNCNSKDLNIKELPLFYERMLQYWFEFKDLQSNKMSYTKKTTIWNNQDIKIDNKTIFFRAWFDKSVHTVRDFVDQKNIKSNKTNRCTARTSYTTMGELESVNSQSHS